MSEELSTGLAPPALVSFASVLDDRSVLAAVSVCLVATLVLAYSFRRKSSSSILYPGLAYAGEGDEKRVVGEIPDSVAPEGGVFTLASLKKFDGRTFPMCLGVCGKVVNVSSSENFVPGFGYGKLWAGCETTYSMAKVSLDPTNTNRFDYKLEDFNKGELDALAGWYKHFTTKYPVVGTLREYDGWDFSKIAKAAETKTPFKSSAAKPAKEEEPAKEKEENGGQQQGLVLRRGAKVMIKGLDARPELDGVVGVLKDFLAEEKQFAVAIQQADGTEETVQVDPANLREPPTTA